MDHFADTTVLHNTRPTGNGIGIAILDTGISPVADFTIPTNRIAVFRDFVNGRTAPYDDNGHGTHVTGAKKRSNARADIAQALPLPFSRKMLLCRS